jgi:hypothetical protein
MNRAVIIQGLVRRVRMGMLLTLAALSLVTSIARAQAPPPSFFAGRSNDELRALASDHNNDVLLRRSAATRLVMGLADAGDYEAAEAAARAFARNIDPQAVKHVRAVRRRGYVHVAAVGALGVAFGVLLTVLVARRRSVMGALPTVRRVVPIVAFFFGYAGLVGGYLATTYENGSADPFLLFAAVMIPFTMILRLWSAVGSPRLAARASRGVAAVAATLAVGFLVVEQVNPSFLEGFGL